MKIVNDTTIKFISLSTDSVWKLGFIIGLLSFSQLTSMEGNGISEILVRELTIKVVKNFRNPNGMQRMWFTSISMLQEGTFIDQSLLEHIRSTKGDSLAQCFTLNINLIKLQPRGKRRMRYTFLRCGDAR